ncbi:hypothetical protein LV779_21590 [Streptomyces thinghirensis]|nr:hypothetical protein [Streptomyces thinghirensis]
MVHQQSSQARLSPSGDTEDIVALLAPRLAHSAGVARTEHVTRAAQEMNVPQSTLPAPSSASKRTSASTCSCAAAAPSR